LYLKIVSIFIKIYKSINIIIIINKFKKIDITMKKKPRWDTWRLGSSWGRTAQASGDALAWALLDMAQG
jgi:hypothetical protein